MPTGKGSEKFHTVMTEFESGRLKDAMGNKIIDKKQALAIAYSEARKLNPNYGKKAAITGARG